MDVKVLETSLIGSERSQNILLKEIGNPGSSWQTRVVPRSNNKEKSFDKGEHQN
jgi:hypothetical protein